MLHGESVPAARDCGCAGSGGFFLECWIASLFGISRLGFRIPCLAAVAGRVKGELWKLKYWEKARSSRP